MLTLITTIRISTTRRTMSTSTGWMLTKYSSSLRATGRSAMMERRYSLISSRWTMIAMSLMMLGFSTSTNRRPSLFLRRRSVSEDSGQLEVIYFLVAQLRVINSRPEILMLLESATSESWTSSEPLWIANIHSSEKTFGTSCGEKKETQSILLRSGEDQAQGWHQPLPPEHGISL